MGWLSGQSNCPFLIMCIGSIPSDDDRCAPNCLEAQYRSGNSLDGPMVLLNDVVETIVLVHQDIDAGISRNTFNGGRVGAAPV